MVDADPSASAIAAAFGLRGTVGELAAVGRAWSHRVYRLTVGDTAYAVKEMRNPWGEAHWRDWLSEAWAFELLALAAGVRAPAPVPNPTDGSCLALVLRSDESAEVFVRVHRWVEGRPADLGPASLDLAAWVGEALAVMHGLGHHPTQRDVFPSLSFDSAHRWPELVAAARVAGTPWAALVAEAAAPVRAIVELAERADHRIADAVMSHGDVDQKNIIIGSDGPYLCDWDVAGPLSPRRELADTAMSMAAWEQSGVARRVVASYRAAGGNDFDLSPQDLGPSLMTGLDWVVLNIERALRLRNVTEHDARLGERLVPGLLENLSDHVELAQQLDRVLGRS